MLSMDQFQIFTDRHAMYNRYNSRIDRWNEQLEFADDCALHSVEKLDNHNYKVNILFVEKGTGTTMLETINMSQKDAKRVIDWFLPFKEVILEALPVIDEPTTGADVRLRLSSR